MTPTRNLCCAAAALAATAAMAEITGPTPLAWRWSTSTSVSPVGSPVVDGDTIFVGVGSRVFALDRKSGNQKWRFPVAEGVPGNFRSGVLKVGDTIVAMADNRTMYAIDANTGASKWQYVSAVPFIKQAVEANGYIVFAGSDNTLNCVKASDGSPAWEGPYRIFNGIDGGLATHQGNVLFMTGGSELIAMNVVTKKQMWKQRLTQVNPDAQPILFGDQIFINSGTYVICMSAATGGVRWQQNLGEFLAFSPAVSTEGIFVTTRDGNAMLLNGSANGRPKWRAFVNLGSVPAASPTASGKTFLVPTSNGNINLINAQFGEMLWTFMVRPVGKVYMGGSGAAGGGGIQGSGGGSVIGGRGGASGGGQGGDQKRLVLSIPAAGPVVTANDGLYVLAQDGSLLAFDKTNGVDVTGPAVKMAWPNPGDQVSGLPPLELIFKIDDEASGVKVPTLKIDIDGKAADFEYSRDGFAIIRISSVGKNRPLMDGRRVITVTVSDWMGNETKTSYRLMIDNTLRPLQRPTGSGPDGGAGAGGPEKGGGGIRGGGG